VSLIADLKSGFVNVAKILQIDNVFETESDQMSLIDKICDRFTKLEAKKNGVNFDSAQRSDSLSGDRNGQHNNSNESNRSSIKQGGDDTITIPQGKGFRKKQPK
jgi:hypothetical protein